MTTSPRGTYPTCRLSALPLDNQGNPAAHLNPFRPTGPQPPYAGSGRRPITIRERP